MQRVRRNLEEPSSAGGNRRAGAHRRKRTAKVLHRHHRVPRHQNHRQPTQIVYMGEEHQPCHHVRPEPRYLHAATGVAGEDGSRAEGHAGGPQTYGGEARESPSRKRE